MRKQRQLPLLQSRKLPSNEEGRISVGKFKERGWRALAFGGMNIIIIICVALIVIIRIFLLFSKART
jgi:hypothetical protein